MAQHDYIISNATFPATRTDINNALSAIQTTNSGTSLPTGAVAGQIWLDTTGTPTANTLKFYDGTDSISLATINYTSNTVDWLDSSVSITGLSTTATGTVLTLSDSSQTSSVNLILQNQKEIRFSETTANGSNYVGFKAPASLTADKIWILPSADATVSGQALTSDASGTLSWTTISAGTAWQSVQTTGFTATSGYGYPCNTTSSAFTVTLPASASVGDTIQIVDYAGTFSTNNLTINPNGLKIQSQTGNRVFATSRLGLTFTYVDSTQGWLLSSGYLEDTNPFYVAPYSIDFLVVAGGGAGGAGAYGGGGGAGGFRTSTQTVASGTVITVTVGDGGAGNTDNQTRGGSGSNSSISGSGLTTITSAGGGGGGANYAQLDGGSGGSGGGGSGSGGPVGAGGSGNTPSTSPSQGNNGGSSISSGPAYGSGGGGGANAVGATGTSGSGGNGGAGTASSITGSSVTRAGGGGGAGGAGGFGTGGVGGGGNANNSGATGTVNTGGGGGGSQTDVGVGNGTIGGAGGKGVVILSMSDANYSTTTTGSPTVATGVSGKTVLTFNGSGSYTA